MLRWCVCISFNIAVAVGPLPDICSGAIEVLDDNWREDAGFTVPAAKLYPHQWSWDTAFIATGHASINITRAKIELRKLFAGQWMNGMVPHIKFNPSVDANKYFPGSNWWQSSTAASGNAPSDIETSGITNPPVHTGAVLQIAHEGDFFFLQEMWPKLDAFLTYFHNERNPLGNGLIYVRHPWENGMDNSPLWDDPLYKGIPNSSLVSLPAYNRTDIHAGVNPRDRPSQAFYDRAVYILLEARKRHYDEKAMWKDGMPFVVFDAFFNALVLRGYEDMVKIAKLLNLPEAASRYSAWADELADAIEMELWDDTKGLYGVKDARSGHVIAVKHVTALAPLFYSTVGKHAKRRTDHIHRLRNLVQSPEFCGTAKCHPLPSLAIIEDAFDSRNYWRGPVWINTNWLLARGLATHAAHDAAKHILTSTQKLVNEHGFYEYFNPLTAEPHGIDSFSWTAALYYESFCAAESIQSQTNII